MTPLVVAIRVPFRSGQAEVTGLGGLVHDAVEAIGAGAASRNWPLRSGAVGAGGSSRRRRCWSASLRTRRSRKGLVSSGRSSHQRRAWSIIVSGDRLCGCHCATSLRHRMKVASSSVSLASRGQAQIRDSGTNSATWCLARSVSMVTSRVCTLV